MCTKHIIYPVKLHAEKGWWLKINYLCMLYFWFLGWSTYLVRCQRRRYNSKTKSIADFSIRLWFCDWTYSLFCLFHMLLPQRCLPKFRWFWRFRSKCRLQGYGNRYTIIARPICSCTFCEINKGLGICQFLSIH